VKVVDENGEGTMEDVIKGLDWVIAKKTELGGRWVVNLSLGGDEASDSEREAFAKASDAGVVVVASTGNDSNASEIAPIGFPAAYPTVIAVGAVTAANIRAPFSNAGPEIDFMAPGVNVLSTIRSGFKKASFVRTGDAVMTSKPVVGAKLQSLTGDYVYCGMGEAKDFTEAVRGKIALIQRGNDTFADKGRRAVAAGAIGIVFYNVNTSNIAWTFYPSGDTEAANYPWPIAVGITLADGTPLAEKGHGRLTIGYESDDYGLKSGTSMSAPHVTGAIALLWSMAPTATPAQLVQALISTATDVGDAGRDDLTGYGAIDVNAAARLLAPEAFTPSTRTGRPFLRRP
jgi:subtilisin family serine protease